MYEPSEIGLSYTKLASPVYEPSEIGHSYTKLASPVYEPSEISLSYTKPASPVYGTTEMQLFKFYGFSLAGAADGGVQDAHYGKVVVQGAGIIGADGDFPADGRLQVAEGVVVRGR